MSDKKLYTREEFDKLLKRCAKAMAKDQRLSEDALKVLVKADCYQWLHQTNWLGEPILNLPQDMFAVQEIIFKTRPKFIIELGVAWGGSLLFYSTLMDVLGGGCVIGVDTYITDDLRKRLSSYGRLSERLRLIEGSSIEQDIFNKIKSIVGDCRAVMVVLDSYHTHEHVLKELQLYSLLVGKGFYLICGDTIVEQIPKQRHRSRPWGPGNNPKTALTQFLNENDRFKVDKILEQKLLFTCNPGGYLKCCKE
ncbi:cephalosporin hydroxylase family protein [Candidatus Omnitrophota bacterium]